MKLSIKAFAFTCALFLGVGCFLVTWWVIIFEGASGDVTTLGAIYRGYNISPLGSVIGLAWGLVDGLIFGALFAWLYNLIAHRRVTGPAAEA